MLQQPEEFFAAFGDHGQQSVEMGAVRRFAVRSAQGERQKIQDGNDNQRSSSADNVLRPPFQNP